MPRETFLRRLLNRSPDWVVMLVTILSAFSTYFCMYAFRKPLGVATFSGMSFFGTTVALKTAIIISQVIGYMLAKYIGIKVCSEVTRPRRATLLVLLILSAEVALLFFAFLPGEAKVLAIFFNGLSLGMVWGLVVLFLEGRRSSEILMAGLSCSYILSDGVVKDVGDTLIRVFNVHEAWMPALTGLIFLLPYMLAVFVLNQVPEPNARDIAERVKREPMNGKQRLAFFFQFLPGIIMLIIVYFFLTALRDFQSNFGKEIFIGLGYAETPGIFSTIAIPVFLMVFTSLALLNLVRNNRWGLVATFGLMGLGMAILSVSFIDPLSIPKEDRYIWMIFIVLGAYLAYVPFGSVLFDRIVASTRTMGTAVFAIYVLDALGYTGSVSMMIYHDLFSQETIPEAGTAHLISQSLGAQVMTPSGGPMAPTTQILVASKVGESDAFAMISQEALSRLAFFRSMANLMVVLGIGLLIPTCIYFLSWKKKEQTQPEPAVAGTSFS